MPNYGEELRDVTIEQAWCKLEAELSKGRRTGEADGWLVAEEVFARLEARCDG